MHGSDDLTNVDVALIVVATTGGWLLKKYVAVLALRWFVRR
jgi:hypothetical protein